METKELQLEQDSFSVNEPYIGMPIEGLHGVTLQDGNMRMMGGACPQVNSCPLAMAYVPCQCWEKTYEPDMALQRGTIFPCLDLPFLGGGGK